MYSKRFQLEGGDVAQLVEQWTENPCVGGSIPPVTTTTKTPCPGVRFLGIFCFAPCRYFLRL